MNNLSNAIYTLFPYSVSPRENSKTQKTILIHTKVKIKQTTYSQNEKIKLLHTIQIRRTIISPASLEAKLW